MLRNAAVYSAEIYPRLLTFFQQVIVLVKRTGIFFSCFQGERLRDFPQALAGIFDKENVAYYDAVYDSRDGLCYLAPLSEELLLKVHSPGMVRRVKVTGDCASALYSAGGTVQAADEVCRGRLIVILCGGSGRSIAIYTIPRIITCLAELDNF